MSDSNGAHADSRALAEPVEIDGGRWRQQAACRGSDPLLFFPAQGKHPDIGKQVCARCPVSVQCAEYAELNGASGVWGGKLRIVKDHGYRTRPQEQLPAHGTPERRILHIERCEAICHVCRLAHEARVNDCRADMPIKGDNG